MAKAEPKKDVDSEPPKKSKKLLFIVLGLVLMLVVGGAAAAFVLMQNKGDEHEEETKKESKKKKDEGPPAFIVLDPFVVNLAAPDNGRYLQIGITYELNSPQVAEQVKVFTPVIRSRILLVLSGKTASNLTTIEGKQQLMDELVDLARVTLPEDPKAAKDHPDPNKGVRDVHFSSFVIQ